MYMRKTVNILGVSFDAVTAAEAAERIFDACQKKGGVPFSVVTPNPLMVMNAREDEELAAALAKADLSVADGVGVVTAARRMGEPLPERVTGIDTAYSVFEKLAEVDGSVYLFGAKPGVAEAAGKKLTEKLPSLRIVGTHHGYLDTDGEIIKDIAEKSPDLIAVCLGSPRQEIWVHNNREKLEGVGAIMCLGGALDVWSGNIKRSPDLFIKMRLEWLWRMMREPRRFAALPEMLKFRFLTRKMPQKADIVK